MTKGKDVGTKVHCIRRVKGTGEADTWIERRGDGDAVDKYYFSELRS